MAHRLIQPNMLQNTVVHDKTKEEKEETNTTSDQIIRPTNLNIITSNTMGHYNMDNIHLTPSPMTTAQPRLFQAGTIISPTTFAQIEAMVSNKSHNILNEEHEEEEEEEEEENSDGGRGADDEDHRNDTFNQDRIQKIQQLTQTILREQPPTGHNEVADTLMYLLDLLNYPSRSTMIDINDIHVDQKSVSSSSSSSMNVPSYPPPYPPINQTGVVTYHDRPYADYGHLDAQTIAEECQFNLDTNDPSSETKDTSSTISTATTTKKSSSVPAATAAGGKIRLSTKTFAITGWTNVSKEIVMTEIKRQFGIERLQYVCVGKEISPKTNKLHLHIQIILKNKGNKKSGFLDKITNTHCNYQVTDNDRAWNEYIKKGGDFIEFNSFKSTTKWGIQYWPSSSSSPSHSLVVATGPTSKNIPLQSTITVIDHPFPLPPVPTTTTIRGRMEEKQKQNQAIAKHAFHLAKTNINDALIFMRDNSISTDFLKYATWYKNTFTLIYLLEQYEKARSAHTSKEYTWPQSFPDCTSELRKFVDHWINEEFNKKTSRAKCLILIGGTGTGKTTFAKSLPGQYNYFQGRWRLESWNDSARYLIFDDIPWDKFDQLGFPPKKALLTQNGLTMATDKYKPSTEINIRQPAIVLLNVDDAGSLIAQPNTVEQKQIADYWQHRTIVYQMGPDEYFHRPDYHPIQNNLSSIHPNQQHVGVAAAPPVPNDLFDEMIQCSRH